MSGRKRGSKMEELKNENVTEQPVAEETVVEQRPSTKYGRTAYQQQLQEEQVAQNQTQPADNQPQQNNYQYWEGPQNPYQQNGNPQSNERPYQQYQNQQQYQQYTPYQEVLPEVKNWPAYVAMVLVVISTAISFAVNIFLSQAYSMGNSLEEVIDATLALSEHPTALVLSTISDVVFVATVAFLVFDIMQLHRAGKKIGGAIAFAILLRPVYFIWRAHLLGQKKAMPIIYAVLVYMITFAQYFVLLSASTEMVMRTML